MFVVGAKTEVGKLRSKNEDSFSADGRRGIFIVADGLGGHPAGEVASKMAVDEIVSFLEGSPEDLPERAVEAVKRANEKIYSLSLGEPAIRGMGTTLVLAIVRGSLLHLSHVGDSRAYVYSETGLRQLTEDHTITYRLYEEGKITKEMIPRHPFHGVLLRALGLEREIEVEEHEWSLAENERLILCTDGLTDMVQDKEMEEILRGTPDPEKACDALVKAAMEKGGRDNITVIVAGRGRV